MALWQPAKTPEPTLPKRADDIIISLMETTDDRTLKLALSDPENSITKLVTGVAGNAPFLASMMARYPEFLARIFVLGPDKCLKTELMATRQAATDARDRAQLMQALRRAKAHISLLVALADIGEAWNLDQVTQALSDFASLALEYATAHLLHQAMTKGDLPWPDNEAAPATPNLARGCGYVILALGKLGGQELNYSSDVDLIALFDSDRVDYRGRKSAGECFVKITRDLIAIMQDRTPDGYVFRTDFRLRPDPGATPLAISLNAAEVYYQTIGQNWERSAMIKARAVAGDMETGAEFLSRMRPFVWRRNLDYAAISDIHAIKSQVHQFHGHDLGRNGAMKIPGTDIKIGPGGIREIEFFAQIQQLIFGGRARELRAPATRDALRALVGFGKLEAIAQNELDEAYVFLRTLEHRLQMIRDEQTHKVPESADGLNNIAKFMGFDDVNSFSDALLARLKTVRRHYDGLPGGDASTPAPEAITGEQLGLHLSALGFDDAPAAIRIIENWRNGRYRALRTARALGLLETLLGPLLSAFAATSEPDRALQRFDGFLSQLPSGIQLFSLFQANPWLFRLIARIMGSAPLLAAHMARHPGLLDTVLTPGFFDGLPTQKPLMESLHQQLALAESYEGVLDQARLWLNDRRFEVGLHILEGRVDVRGAGKALSLLADIVLDALIPEVERHFAERHGVFPGCGANSNYSLGAIAMGSYGGEELSYTSDLDIVFLYQAPGADQVSNGKRPLPPSQYFSRLGQQVITALTAHTAAGGLFELDLRLRPSGRAGPLVVTLETFKIYQQNEAWTWEHMALTRARVVYGSHLFRDQIEIAIANTLAEPRPSEALRRDVSQMRDRTNSEFATDNIWALRNIRGGLVDVEYICQFTLLKAGGARTEHPPTMLETIASLAEANLMAVETAEQLSKAQHFMQTIRGILALCHGPDPNEETFSNELKSMLVDATGETSFTALKQRLEETQMMVYALYQHTITDEEPDEFN